MLVADAHVPILGLITRQDLLLEKAELVLSRKVADDLSALLAHRREEDEEDGTCGGSVPAAGGAPATVAAGSVVLALSSEAEPSPSPLLLPTEASSTAAAVLAAAAEHGLIAPSQALGTVPEGAPLTSLDSEFDNGPFAELAHVGDGPGPAPPHGPGPAPPLVPPSAYAPSRMKPANTPPLAHAAASSGSGQAAPPLEGASASARSDPSSLPPPSSAVQLADVEAYPGSTDPGGDLLSSVRAALLGSLASSEFSLASKVSHMRAAARAGEETHAAAPSPSQLYPHAALAHGAPSSSQLYPHAALTHRAPQSSQLNLPGIPVAAVTGAGVVATPLTAEPVPVDTVALMAQESCLVQGGPEVSASLGSGAASVGWAEQ